jgi:hypothetical protein
VSREPRAARPSIDELVRRYRAGESCAAIAAAIGSSPMAVHMRLKRAGVKLGPRGRPVRPAPGVMDAEPVARYAAGESLGVIAAATGLRPAAIHDRLRRAGVELRSVAEARRNARLDLPVAEIIERYRGGESAQAIGRSFGVSGQVIRERLIEAGVERRRRGTHRRRAEEEQEGR